MISLVLIIFVVSNAFAAWCPDEKAILPCVCSNDAFIKCTLSEGDKNKQKEDLMNAFEKMMTSTPYPMGMGFNDFVLTSTELEVLPENVFQGAWFHNIKLNYNPKLKCIHPKAFGLNNNLPVYTFTAVKTSLADVKTSKINDKTEECDLFGALRNFTNLQTINITLHDMTEIPKGAFHQEDEIVHTQNALNSIDLSGGWGGNIRKIDERAFASLKYIRYIDISNHKINNITTDAFRFSDKSDYIQLVINLDGNQGLNGESFKGNVFNEGNRIITLRLRHLIALTYLKSETFDHFLDVSKAYPNKIDLFGTFLYYDKRNEWLFDYPNPDKLENKISNGVMCDGLPLYQKKEEFEKRIWKPKNDTDKKPLCSNSLTSSKFRN